ncbi:hypothetical protein D3C85_1007290 [compost metagenome]
MLGAGQRTIDDVEGRTHLVAHIQGTLQTCIRVLFQGHVDPFRHGQLTQLLLHLGDALAVLRQVGVGVFQGVVQVSHQLDLELPLARVGALPLGGDPLLDDGRAAVMPLLDHAIDPQRRQLRVAAGWRGVDRLQRTAGDGR